MFKSADKQNIRSWPRNIIIIFFAALAFFFLGKIILENRQALSLANFSFNGWYLALSFLLSWSGVIWLGYAWKKVIDMLEPENTLPLSEAIRIHVYSWISRYIPGKVVSLMSKIYLAEERYLSRGTIYLSNAFDAVLSLAAIFLLAGMFLFAVDMNFAGAELIIAVLFLSVLLGLVAFLGSPSFYGIADRVLRIVNKPSLTYARELSWEHRFIAVLYYLLGDILRGMGFFFLIRSFVDLSLADAGGVIGLFAIAGALSMVSIIMPAGIGVREGVLAIGFRIYFSTGMAAVFAVVARLWEVAADVALFYMVVLCKSALHLHQQNNGVAIFFTRQIQRLNNIFVLALCTARFIFCGKADKKNKNLKKILVISAGKLGDVVCTTPVFSAIKKHYPESKTIIDNNGGINEKILERSGLVDGYMEFGNIFASVKNIRKHEIDFACLTGPSFHALAAIYLSGVPFIVAPAVKGGYCPQETRAYRILSWFVITAPFYMGRYAPSERLRVLEFIGIFASNTKKHLGFSEVARDTISKFFTKNNVSTSRDFVVGISLSAGNKIKLWGMEKFARVAEHICRTKPNAKIVIIGGRDDIMLAEEFFGSFGKNDKVIDTSGLFNIDELKALMARLHLFISVDTGPIYIAEAFGVPTIDIVGPMDEREQPPVGDSNKIVKVADRKNAELHIMNARVYNILEAKRQTDEITAEMVIDVVDELLDKLK